MGIYVMKLPDVGEGIAEAEIVEWAVKPGDVVREDDPLGAVMTDKASVEIPSPVSGVVKSLGGELGVMLAVGADFVTLEVAGEDVEDDAAKASVATTAPIKDTSHEDNDKVEEDRVKKASAASAPSSDAGITTATAQTTTNITSGAPHDQTSPKGAPRREGEKPIASPAVRKRANDAGVKLQFVHGSGPAGRIEHADLDAYIAGNAAGLPASKRRTRKTQVDEVKVIGLRRKIAERMQESKRRIPHFAYVEEVDVTEIEALRVDLNSQQNDARPKLTILPFIISAVVNAVRDYPQMNARYQDDEGLISRFGAVHVGIATQTPNGLLVPVIRHAESLSLFEYALAINQLAQAAREGTASRDELSGSTITISSLGRLGGIVSTPVINYPEVAIVGVNKIATRPAWQNNQFVPRAIMNLSSSFDHRVVDGADAAAFIQRIKNLLEHPAKLFMEFD